MAGQQIKAAYVCPIKDLSVMAGRVSEQVCGRLVHHFTETFKKGSSKTVAVIVDGESLRSVLVLEAWSAQDQAHMNQSLLPHAGKVVSVTNFKVQSKGRSLVYFDRDLKVAFDKLTKVAPAWCQYKSWFQRCGWAFGSLGKRQCFKDVDGCLTFQDSW